MARKNRRGIEYPEKFMKRMKKQKRKKMRQTKITETIIEQELNNAEMEI